MKGNMEAKTRTRSVGRMMAAVMSGDEAGPVHLARIPLDSGGVLRNSHCFNPVTERWMWGFSIPAS